MTEFPVGFFDRADESPDAVFYGVDRFVTHIDPSAVAVVGDLYRELGVAGDVLDICSSWISHFDPAPERLIVMGMNGNELARNEAASESLVHDLNVDPILPFPDSTFDTVTCAVSVDYLTRPVEVFADVGRVLKPGAPFVVTFSNRCFPTKAVRGWLAADDHGRCTIVSVYFAASQSFGPPTIQLRNPSSLGDPLFGIWARALPAGLRIRGLTTGDQAFVSDMQYEAMYVPPGDEPFERSILDEPGVAPYHAEFGSQAGDVGKIALGADGTPIGAAWVRRIHGYGFVDDPTPELSIAVIQSQRGRSVGTSLLESLLADVPRCSLSVDHRNAAMALYERLGFETIRRDGEHGVVMLRDGGRAS